MDDAAKINKARLLLRKPFVGYTDLDDRERKACALVARGMASRDIAHELDCSIRSAYNVVDRALLKISKAEGKMIRREDLTGLVFDKVAAALKNGKG